MEYKAFTEYFAGMVKEKLGEDYDVRLTEVVKNNQVTLHGVAIMGKQEKVVPTIYLEGFYARYLQGEKQEELAEELVSFYYQNSFCPKLDTDKFGVFSEVKDSIYYRLVNYEMNENLLKEQPHLRWNDLAVTFYYVLETAGEGRASVTIKKPYLEMWGIEEEELYRTAHENMQRKKPEILMTMKEILEEMMSGQLSEEYHVPMYVLTNTEKLYGAATLLYSHKIKELADRLKNDLLIIPSSVHEVLLMEDGAEQDYDWLRSIVKEVNRSQVEPDEVLAESLYRYVWEKEKIEEIVS